MHQTQTQRFGIRTAPGVGHMHVRMIDHMAVIERFERDVAVLLIEEVAGIKALHLIQRMGADHHKAAGRKLHMDGLRDVFIAQGVFIPPFFEGKIHPGEDADGHLSEGVKAGFRLLCPILRIGWVNDAHVLFNLTVTPGGKALADMLERPSEKIAHGWATMGQVLLGAIREKDPGGEHHDVRMLVHIVHHAGDKTGIKGDVRIDNHMVGAFQVGNDYIVAPAVAEVLVFKTEERAWINVFNHPEHRGGLGRQTTGLSGMSRLEGLFLHRLCLFPAEMTLQTLDDRTIRIFDNVELDLLFGIDNGFHGFQNTGRCVIEHDRSGNPRICDHDSPPFRQHAREFAGSIVHGKKGKDKQRRRRTVVIHIASDV